VILVRDLVVIAGVVAMRNTGREVRVDMLGKFSSFLVMAAVGLALLSTAKWIDVVFWIAVGLSVVTFANYVRTAVKALRGRGSSTQT
jgi:phosphatidylglycerophosphate synthase